MNVLITGVSGFLGGALAKLLLRNGHLVSGTARSVGPEASPVEVHAYTLGEPFSLELLERCDAIIHCAHDFSPNGNTRTLAGTKALMDAATATRKSIYQLYVSSCSADPRSPVSYGAVKYELEQLFLRHGHAVVRPGLVIGDGGMYRRQAKAILRTPLVPLLDGGRDMIRVVALADCVQAVSTLTETRQPGEFNLFAPEWVSMRQFVETIALHGERSPILCSIPSDVAVFVLRMIQQLGVRLPINPDSIISLRLGRDQSYTSHLPTLVPNYLKFREMVGQTLFAEK